MNKNLGEVAALFFKLGLTAFGGPAAHIAMMQDEVVQKRKWIDEQHFLDLVGATNLIPGPNSTEMAIHCGHERAGVAGLFTAGAAFILPACLISGLLAAFYKKYGALPQVEPFFYGIKPAVLMIILGTVYTLGKKAVKNRRLAALGAATLLCAAAGANTLALILLAGAAGMLWLEAARRARGRALSVEPVSLFLLFFKVGAVLFGSGFVMVAYLQTALVEQTGWLTQQQMLDAIAIGQFTPGPILSAAAFIGYLIAGVPGSAAAVLGIFLPSFFFVWALNPLVPKLRKSQWMASFLDAINVASVGVMAGVALMLGRQVLTDWRGGLIALVSAAAIFGPKKVSVVWLIAGGSVLGRLLLLF